MSYSVEIKSTIRMGGPEGKSLKLVTVNLTVASPVTSIPASAFNLHRILLAGPAYSESNDKYIIPIYDEGATLRTLDAGASPQVGSFAAGFYPTLTLLGY